MYFLDEFNRAVKICIGKKLSKHVVRIIFDMFDENKSGRLSYDEFIVVMKNRATRAIIVCIYY